MKCPICGSSKVQSTNTGQRVLGRTAQAITSVILFPINKGGGYATSREVYHSICPEEKYICLNPNCRHIFTVSTKP